MTWRPDFAAHRATVLERLADDEAVLVFGGPMLLRNGDAEHRYRPDSDVWWLTGWPDAEVAVFLRPGDEPFTMFVQPRNPEAEVWTGRRAGPEGAMADFGADRALSWEDLEAELPRLLQGVRALHYGFGRDPEMDRLLNRCIAKAARAVRTSGLCVPETFHGLGKLLHELRLVKTDAEIAVLREAARITREAHTHAMTIATAGMFEYEIESAIDSMFRRQGGVGPGYTSIVASGDNANILHYITNDAELSDGDLVLIDAGCELGFYTADVTRTWPVSGRFTEPQAQLYQAVLDAQMAAIDACRPGTEFMDVHDLTIRKLTEAMVRLELLDGDVDELIAEKAYRKYYMHGTSHWLGIDVHDVGAYTAEGTSRVLKPGMVLTIEPGLYVPLTDDDAPERFRGIGIRIEDDVLVTDGAPDVLTVGTPKTLDEVEAACQGHAAA